MKIHTHEVTYCLTGLRDAIQYMRIEEDDPYIKDIMNTHKVVDCEACKLRSEIVKLKQELEAAIETIRKG